MYMYGWIFLAIAFICNSVANVFLKIGSQDGFVFSKNILKLIQSNKFLIRGGILFGINLIFYVLAMKSIPISVAYPIMIGMSLTIITTIGFFFLHESVTYMHIVAYVLIFLGIFLLIYANK